MNEKAAKLCEFLYLPTTRCNCRCKHCNPKVYCGKDIEMSSKMLIDKYEKSEFLRNNAVSVAGGEPFLKNDLDEFIIYLDRHKIPTVISTNGWFTDRIERLIDQLEDCNTVRFAISIDGPEEMHDEIRKCKGIYQRAVSSAILLKRRGFNVQVNMVIQKDNLDYLEEFDKFFKENCIPVIYIPVVFVGEERFNFTVEDIKKILHYANYPRARKYLLSKGKWKIEKTCHAGKNTWMLDCNGDVYACWGGYYKDSSSEYIMGNLFESEFDDIFASARKLSVCSEIVKNCEGCLLPRDIERETDVFDYSTQLTFEEVSVLAETLTNVCSLNDYAISDKEWYGTEKWNDKCFKWMRAREVTLYVNVNKVRPNQIVVHYLNGYVDTRTIDAMSMCIRLQDKVNIQCDCELGENTIAFDIPETFTDTGLIQIKLQVNKMWKPAEINPNSSDQRELGIGIFDVGLF